ELRVDRQLDRLSRRRLTANRELAARAAERIDPKLRDACATTQVPVVARLDSRLADLVSEPVAALVQELQLSRRDLAHVSEELGADRAVRVAAQVGLCRLDPWELALMLEQIVDQVVAHALLHGHWGDRIPGALCNVQKNLMQRNLQNAREPAKLVIPPCLRQVGRRDLNRSA